MINAIIILFTWTYSLQYYDWDTNMCHHLELLEENSISMNIISDTEIPREVRAQNRDYFPELEPKRLEEMVSQ